MFQLGVSLVANGNVTGMVGFNAAFPLYIVLYGAQCS